MVYLEDERWMFLLIVLIVLHDVHIVWCVHFFPMPFCGLVPNCWHEHNDAFQTLSARLIGCWLLLCVVGGADRHLLLTQVGKFRDLGCQPACHWDAWVGTQVDWLRGCRLSCRYRGTQNRIASIWQKPMSYLCCTPEGSGPSSTWQVADMLNMSSTGVSARGRGENISKEVFS